MTWAPWASAVTADFVDSSGGYGVPGFGISSYWERSLAKVSFTCTNANRIPATPKVSVTTTLHSTRPVFDNETEPGKNKFFRKLNPLIIDLSLRSCNDKCWCETSMSMSLQDVKILLAYPGALNREWNSKQNMPKNLGSETHRFRPISQIRWTNERRFRERAKYEHA